MKNGESETTKELGNCQFFTETISPYGTLECIAIYAWYEGPLAYVLRNENHLLFVYWFDVDNGCPTYWYVPLTELQLSEIENKKVCLRTVLSSNTGEAITYDSSGNTISRSAITYQDEQLPQYGIYLEQEHV